MSIAWDLVRTASDNVEQYISDEPSSPFPTKLVIRAMRLLRLTLADYTDPPSTAKGEEKSSTCQPELANECCRLLVSRLMPLRQADLEAWTSDPEDWVIQEESDQWEFELRVRQRHRQCSHTQPCAAKLWSELLNEYSDSLAGFVQELYALASSNGGDLISRDAVYAALGANTTKLATMIDFVPWLLSSITQAAANALPERVAGLSLKLTPTGGSRCSSEERSGCLADGRPSQLAQMLTSDSTACSSTRSRRQRLTTSAWRFRQPARSLAATRGTLTKRPSSHIWPPRSGASSSSSARLARPSRS